MPNHDHCDQLYVDSKLGSQNSPNKIILPLDDNLAIMTISFVIKMNIFASNITLKIILRIENNILLFAQAMSDLIKTKQDSK